MLTHTHTDKKQQSRAKKSPKGVVCYEKTKHKKKRNGDLNISHKCQTVRRLQSTPTSATLSPSLPPLFFSHSKPKPKKQATVDYSPPLLCLMLKKEKLAVTSRPSQQSTTSQEHKRIACKRTEARTTRLLARSLALAQQHPRNTHARTHSRRRAQRRTRETVTGRSGRRGLGLPDSAG